jgi:hypothetical protein
LVQTSVGRFGSGLPESASFIGETLSEETGIDVAY